MTEARKLDEREERIVLISVSELKRIVAEAVHGARAENAQIEYLTAAQVAELVNTTTRSVQSWAKNGTMPAVRIGAEYRFKRADVLAWISERATTPAAADGRRKRR